LIIKGGPRITQDCRVDEVGERSIVSRGLTKLISVYERTVLQNPDRAPNPYATHVPILAGLAVIRDVRRVIELGCGNYSTMIFLDRVAFPSVERVDSYENDKEWASKMIGLAGGDSRLHMTVDAKPMADLVRQANLDECDVLLIDDSQTAAGRSATIEAVASARPLRPLVVIHDFEVVSYRRAARGFDNRLRLTCMNPNIGLAWNGALINKGVLRRISRLVRQNAEQIPTEDAAGWSVFLEGALRD
jgi:hypothetical protein